MNVIFAQNHWKPLKISLKKNPGIVVLFTILTWILCQSIYSYFFFLLNYINSLLIYLKSQLDRYEKIFLHVLKFSIKWTLQVFLEYGIFLKNFQAPYQIYIYMAFMFVCEKTMLFTGSLLATIFMSIIFFDK